MGLLKTIAIIILVYYVVKILSRIFAPFLIRYVAKKAERKFTEQFKQHAANQRQKEGEVTIERAPKTNTSKKVGEYIDFEEID